MSPSRYPDARRSRPRRGLRPVAVGVLALALALAGCTSDGGDDDGATKDASALDKTTVTTTSGPVRGATGSGYRSFLGLPYAAPPVGPLRWKPPAAPASWTTPRDATKPGAFCPQKSSLVAGGPSGDGGVTEDCLFLNVYTPTSLGVERARTADKVGKLPVMVWIHGGSYTSGAGSDYGPGRLVNEGGVIVVTINYRLGALGFLALAGLSAETPAGSGDYGILDQQAALTWVQKNIKAFGGDPENVTAFGESAGGASICANLASPGAKGLITKAIVESGCALPTPAKAVAERTGATFAQKLGCTGPGTVACLRTKKPQQILAAPTAAGALLPWAPVAGTAVLPAGPETALGKGTFAKVPFLQGTNHDEGRLFVVAEGVDKIPAAAYPSALRQFAGSAAPRIQAEYPLSKFNGSAPDAMGAIITDVTFACPARRTSTLAAKRSPTWQYEFNDPNAPLPKLTYPLRAAHAAELPYLFDLERVGALPGGSIKLGRQMVAYWTSFAATGNPSGKDVDAPAWPKLAASGGSLQSLVPAGSRRIPAAAFDADHHCAFWDALPPLDLGR